MKHFWEPVVEMVEAWLRQGDNGICNGVQRRMSDGEKVEVGGRDD